MAWTTPRNWSVGELVTASEMNTHVRDNLNYLKSDPVIASGSSSTLVQTNGGAVAVVTLSAVSIPSDIGACYVEAWSPRGIGFYNAPSSGSWFNWGTYTDEASAGTLIDSTQNWFKNSADNDFSWPTFPYYMRTPDLAWAGSTRTVTIYAYSGGGVGCQMYSPTYLRIVRSY